MQHILRGLLIGVGTVLCALPPVHAAGKEIRAKTSRIGFQRVITGHDIRPFGLSFGVWSGEFKP